MIKTLLFAMAVAISFMALPPAVAQYEDSSSIEAEEFWDDGSYDDSYDGYYHTEVEVIHDPWTAEDEMEYEASDDIYHDVEENPYYDESEDWY